MKAIRRSTLLLLSGLLLGACGEPADIEAVEPKEDVAENWTAYIREGDAALESYTSDTQLNLILESGPEAMTEEDEAFIHMQMIGNLEQGYTEDAIGALYFEENDIYVQEGNTWVFYPDSGPIEYPSWYPHIVDALVEIEHLVEAASADGSVELFYEGNDPEVWEAFEEEFTLAIEGVSQENVYITLNAVIDDTDYYLQDLNIDILGEEQLGAMGRNRINIQIAVDYYDHNQVDLTNIEKEITQDIGI